MTTGATAFYGAPLASARAAVILIHGRGQGPADMLEQIVRRLDVPGLSYVAPAAAGRTWYPAPFMKPLEENQPQLAEALDRLAQLSDRLAEQGVAPAAQIVMGFSQGACLGCEYVYRRRRRLAALIAFTGGLIGPPGIAWDGAGARAPSIFSRMPVSIEGSDQDPWVPAARMRETAAVFERLGAAVSLRLQPSTAHEISDAQIAGARLLVQGVVG
jgi:phospholipase/carboxylesterase